MYSSPNALEGKMIVHGIQQLVEEIVQLNILS